MGVFKAAVRLLDGVLRGGDVISMPRMVMSFCNPFRRPYRVIYGLQCLLGGLTTHSKWRKMPPPLFF